jgi:hypothetical protein
MKTFKFAILGALANAASYSSTQSETSLNLTKQTYCSDDLRSFNGSAANFQKTLVIDNPAKDTAGFIGYLPTD